MTEAPMTSVYAQGVMAFHAYVPLVENPFPLNSPEAVQWAAGWEAAHKDYVGADGEAPQ